MKGWLTAAVILVLILTLVVAGGGCGDDEDDIGEPGSSGRWNPLFNILSPSGNSTLGWLTGIHGNSSYDVFVVGQNNTIFHYDGNSWSEWRQRSALENSSLRYQYSSIWGSSSSDVFAVGWGGVIMHYDGSTWRKMNSGTTKNLTGVWGSSASDVFAVGIDSMRDYNSSRGSGYEGYGGIILHYDGSIWSEMDGDIGEINDIWGSSPSDVFAIGLDQGIAVSSSTRENPNIILHYDGSTWTKMESNTGTFLYDVWGNSPSDVFAVGLEGTILHYDGNNWSEMESGTTEFLYGIWGSSSSNVFAVGEKGTIMHYDGNAWSEMSLQG